MDQPIQDTDVSPEHWRASHNPYVNARGRGIARNLTIAIYFFWCLIAMIYYIGGYFAPSEWIGLFRTLIGWSFFLIPGLELVLIRHVFRYRLPFYWIIVSLMPIAVVVFLANS